MNRHLWKIAAIGITGFFISSAVTAEQLIDFENASVNSEFAGDTAGNTAGPFLIDNIPTTFTTTSVDGVLAASSFGLGINNGGGDPDTESFNIGESWSFRTDAPLLLISIDIGGLQSEETFDLQSNDWVNLSGINPGNGVTYEASTGTFTLTDGPANDVFTINDLTGGTVLSFKPGTDLTLGNLTSSFGPNDDVELQSITFRSVPEPGSMGLLIAMSVGFCFRKSRKPMVQQN